jgi:hypothetical protein
MPIDYLTLLRQLVEERESWIRQRDDAMRQVSRLDDLIRSTAKMLPPEERAKCDILFERIDQRPAGLTIAIRLCFTAGKEWLTPVEIRDHLKTSSFNFERYKANPLASIHTTLKRMVPHEIECKTIRGEKRYRLKTADQWLAALSEARNWLKDHDYVTVGASPWFPATEKSQKPPSETK